MFRAISVHLQEQLYKLYIAFGICRYHTSVAMATQQLDVWFRILADARDFSVLQNDQTEHLWPTQLHISMGMGGGLGRVALVTTFRMSGATPTLCFTSFIVCVCVCRKITVFFSSKICIDYYVKPSELNWWHCNILSVAWEGNEGWRDSIA